MKLTKEQIRKSYTEFIGRSIKLFGLVSFNKIPKEYYKFKDVV